MASLAWLALVYLVGAVPFGLVVGKIICGVDPRDAGSRNTGATNVARLCGFKYGVMALVLDLGKGLIPVLMAHAISDSHFFVGLTGLVAVVGHCYSVFLHGKGGKAVATTAGAFFGMAPWSMLISAVVCLTIIWKTGFVSVGSLTLVVVLPLLLLFSGQFTYLLFALVVMVLVFWRHRDNIQRLSRGEEKPWRKGQ